jgi:CubicO group peptidase (beta-lactamase class C family)
MADTLTAAGLAAVHAVAEKAVADGAFPGLVVLVARGNSEHVEAAGQLSVGGAPVMPDSLFRIASMTKPVTGAATMALIEEGVIGLDEPVDRLLPELADRRVLRKVDGPLDDTVPANRAITTRDLLTFTFGFGVSMEMFMAPDPLPIVVASDEAHLSTIGPPNRAIQPDQDTWIAGLGSLPLIAQPGERWMYNTGASVLGILLSRAAGMSFGDVLRTRIFEPLGMTQTAFWASDPDRLAAAYRPSADGLEMWDAPDGEYSRPPAFEDGAAGLVSTASDMLAFARMFLRGGSPVLSAESVRAMTTDQLTPEQKAHGGLGPDFFASQSWSYCQAVADSGAFGWNGGFGTSWLVDAASDLVVTLLTQRMFSSPDDTEVHDAIQAAAYSAIG